MKPGEEAYQLTRVGALLSAQGQELEDHLTKFFEYCRDRFDADTEIKGFSGPDVQSALGLTAEQANALFRLLWISALCGGGGKGRDLQAWSFGLPYDIEDIHCEVRGYLEARLLKDFDPSVPFAAGERERHFLRRGSGYGLLDEPARHEPSDPHAGLPKGTSSGSGPARFTEERIRKLRGYRESLIAIRENLSGLAAERAGVVPSGHFRVLTRQLEEAEREFPELLPRFVAEDFFAERFPSGDHYNISTMLSYLGSALGRIEAELADTRPTLEGLHLDIVAAAGALYTDGHYATAIFEAFKAVEVRVRTQSRIDSSGRDLMARAFGGEPPAISVESIGGRSGQDEQEGFKLIFMGATQGIRNPKGHELMEQIDA